MKLNYKFVLESKDGWRVLEIDYNNLESLKKDLSDRITWSIEQESYAFVEIDAEENQDYVWLVYPVKDDGKIDFSFTINDVQYDYQELWDKVFKYHKELEE